MSKKNKTPDRNIIASNRKAKYNYFIEETYEAGIVLLGSEVKSLRQGKVNITEGYVDEIEGELFLLNVNISEYKGANRFNHKPKRARKLLMHRREIKKFIGKLQIQGFTIVPISLYFNAQNKVKVEIGLGKGKKLYDKRETEKQRDWDRQKSRILKGE